MFYDYQNVLSYNALINILLGERGVGKTYGITKFIVKQFLKNKDEFVYIRRYKKELKSACSNFFDAINKNNEFPEHNLTFKKGKFMCDDEIIGYPVCLSTSQDLKSVNFSNVKWIIFDEFIIEEGQKKYYLQNEVFVFLNLIETISRLRDTRVFMLSNSANIINPYFIKFDIQVEEGKIKLFKDNLILVQHMQNLEYREEKNKTRFGQLIKDTEFGDYAINNKFIGNNTEFIKNPPPSAKTLFNFYFNNLDFKVLYQKDKIFICKNDKNLKKVNINQVDINIVNINFDLDNISDNQILFKKVRNYPFFTFFKNAILTCNCYYQNIEIKTICKELIKRII